MKVKLIRYLGLGLSTICLGILAACNHGEGPTQGTSPATGGGKSATVGLLVPQSSADSDIAGLSVHLENGASLAVADIMGAELELVIYDTAGTAEGAIAAVEQAARDNVDIILGPTFAETTAAAAPVAASHDLTILSLSNDTSVAGNNVFILGISFSNTAEAILAHGLQQGRARPFVVFSEDVAGNRGMEAVSQAAAQLGIEMAGSRSYEFTQMDVVRTVKETSEAIRLSNADLVIFTADAFGALPLLAQLLPENGVDFTRVQLAGLTRWDIPSDTLATPSLQGGWFARPNSANMDLFEAMYRTTFSLDPHPLAALAFEGIAVVGALVRTSGANALSPSGLVATSGFAGIHGDLRFRDDGLSVRNLAVAEVQNNDWIIVSSVPLAAVSTPGDG